MIIQVRVGMSVGHSPHVESHKPDMKKDESAITQEDRQEARRRIEGSIAPDSDRGSSWLPGSSGRSGGLSSLNPANIQ